MLHIRVDTENRGAVALTGNARSQEDINRAVAIAGSIKGVRTINNAIVVKTDL